MKKGWSRLVCLVVPCLLDYSGAKKILTGGTEASHNGVCLRSGSVTNLRVRSDRDLANAIRRKIIKNRFRVSYQVEPAVNLETKQIQDLLRVGLKRVNPELTPRDLSLITFQGGRLSAQESAPVFAHIMVGEVELIKNLFVSMAPPTAHDIVNKITQSNLSVPWQSQHRVDAPAGIWVLQQALRQVNPTLSREDVAQITFSAEKQLIVNVAIPVLATVNTGSDTASKLVLVTMKHPCAHDIASKIMHHRITVSMQEDPDVKALKTTIAIRTSLQRVNPSLSNVDLEKISFRGGFLATATEVPVGGLVVVGTQQAHFKLLVTMLQGSVADIIAKITCYRFKIG